MKSAITQIKSIATLMIVTGLLCACGDESTGSTDSTSAVSNPPPSGNSNSAPTISGTPADTTMVNTSYSFAPSASDPDGDTLIFSAQNLPVWASFNTSTGELSGNPSVGDVGSYSNISVSVSDGSLSASLSGFTVNVVDTGNASVTLSWTAPTQNTNGSFLNDLAGYKIYYGVTEGDYPNEIVIENPGVTVYVVDNLVPDTYYFVATSINSSGIESGYSNVAAKDAS